LLENPLLEETAEEVKTEEAETAEANEQADQKPAEDTKPEEPKDEKDSFDEIDYDAYFQDYIEYGYNPRMNEEHEEFPIENTLTRPPNLADHLSWQLSMSDASPRTKEIAQFIIGNIDEDGYLRATEDEIAQSGGYTAEEVETAVRAVQSLDPEQPIADVRTMEQWVDRSLENRRSPMMLFALFGVVAVLLSAIGIYGVLAFNVAQRVREFGIRQALGADRRSILRLVFAQGLMTAGTGLVLEFS
jgi:RNA polymerase sigma-54 factor